jgi:AraC-type DNA-binding domain-containing proteins
MPGLVLSTARFAEYRFEPHYHLDYHIALVSEGVQRQSFQGGTLLLTPGVIQLMPAGEVHDGIAVKDESYTLQTFRLSSELVERCGEEITGKHYLPSQPATVLQDRALAEQLLGLHARLHKEPADRLLDEIRVFDLFESLFSRLLRPEPQNVSGVLTPPQLDRVREFMESHLCEKIVLDDLALLLGLERFRFLKLFKRTVRMTPHAWLLRLRLERAVALITKQADMPLTEVAHAVGFFDQSHFTHAFRNAYGVPPSHFSAPRQFFTS